ncbi:MAG: hypothetical protein KBE16_07520 [Alphaproteobacteria bacterium]|nr:hypothetical protein [Alphaproteobacteria bacterium]MBP9878290.1 hypothetical protein [Alphaproteobacteria bacterium]
MCCCLGIAITAPATRTGTKLFSAALPAALIAVFTSRPVKRAATAVLTFYFNLIQIEVKNPSIF